MNTLNLEIKKEDIYGWEEKLGKGYENWSEEEKVAFLVSIASKNVPALDACINHLQLGDLGQTPFGSKISSLRKLGFRILMVNDFKYVGITDRIGKQAKEVILFHPSGLLYYATSTQEGLSLGRTTDVKRSELYFQVSTLKEDASNEAFRLLNKGSGIQYSDKTIFKSYTGIKTQEIETLLNNCNFVEPWSVGAPFSLLNESDVCECVNGKIMQKFDVEDAERQIEKIDLFPEEVKICLGYSKQKRK